MPKDSRSFAPKRKGDYGNGGAPGESYNVDNGGGTTLWSLTSPKRTSPKLTMLMLKMNIVGPDIKSPQDLCNFPLCQESTSVKQLFFWPSAGSNLHARKHWEIWTQQQRRRRRPQQQQQQQQQRKGSVGLVPFSTLVSTQTSARICLKKHTVSVPIIAIRKPEITVFGWLL